MRKLLFPVIFLLAALSLASCDPKNNGENGGDEVGLGPDRLIKAVYVYENGQKSLYYKFGYDSRHRIVSIYDGYDTMTIKYNEEGFISTIPDYVVCESNTDDSGRVVNTYITAEDEEYRISYYYQDGCLSSVDIKYYFEGELDESESESIELGWAGGNIVSYKYDQDDMIIEFEYGTDKNDAANIDINALLFYDDFLTVDVLPFVGELSANLITGEGSRKYTYDIDDHGYVTNSYEGGVLDFTIEYINK